MLVVVDRALRSPSLVLAELRTSLSFSPHFKAAAPCACLLHYYGDLVVAIFLANLPGKHRVYGRILTHIFSLIACQCHHGQANGSRRERER